MNIPGEAANFGLLFSPLTTFRLHVDCDPLDGRFRLFFVPYVAQFPPASAMVTVRYTGGSILSSTATLQPGLVSFEDSLVSTGA